MVPLGIPFQNYQGFFQPRYPESFLDPWDKSSLKDGQGEEGQLARLSFEARPTILWLQDEFAHATQEMEALVPMIFLGLGRKENPGWRVFTNWWGFGARFFEVKPDYEFGIKSISFTAHGWFFVRKGSSMLADEDQFSRTETYSPD